MLKKIKNLILKIKYKLFNKSMKQWSDILFGKTLSEKVLEKLEQERIYIDKEKIKEFNKKLQEKRG